MKLNYHDSSQSIWGAGFNHDNPSIGQSLEDIKSSTKVANSGCIYANFPWKIFKKKKSTKFLLNADFKCKSYIMAKRLTNLNRRIDYGKR